MFIVEFMVLMLVVEEFFVDIDVVVDFVVLFIWMGVVEIDVVVSVVMVKMLYSIFFIIIFFYWMNGDLFKRILGVIEYI